MAQKKMVQPAHKQKKRGVLPYMLGGTAGGAAGGALGLTKSLGQGVKGGLIGAGMGALMARGAAGMYRWGKKNFSQPHQRKKAFALAAAPVVTGVGGPFLYAPIGLYGAAGDVKHLAKKSYRGIKKSYRKVRSRISRRRKK